MKKLLFLILFLTGCEIVADDVSVLKADAYLDEVPSDKTAVLQLQNKKIRENNLEYIQFYRKLVPILQEKGYRIVDKNQPHSVVLKLYFGVAATNFAHMRFGVQEQMNEPAEAEELNPSLSAIYTRVKLYSKFLRLTAVDARNPKRELWKVIFSKEDPAEDFRSAQYDLLYLFSRYMEKDSTFQITGKIPDAEIYQRFILHLSPEKTDLSVYMPMERKNDYQQRLQAKIDANPEMFADCGLKNPAKVRFELSALGTIRALKTSADNKECLAEKLENMLSAPIGIPENEMFVVKIPQK